MSTGQHKSGQGSRGQILGRIRASLNRVEPLHASIQANLEHRLKYPRTSVQPAISGDLLQRFKHKAQASGATIECLQDGHLPGRALQSYLDQQGLPAELVLSGEPLVRKQEWLHLEIFGDDRLVQSDAVFVSTASVAIAETGTCLLVSGSNHLNRSNFLADTHVVLLEKSQIVPHIENAWVWLREQTGAIPRACVLLSGPSKTADVEQTIQIGAHGPRRLHYLVLP